MPAGAGGGLPGEAGPLVYEAGRATPVTDDEALGVLRRGRRIEAARRGSPVDAPVVAELPGWTVPREPLAVRLPPRLWARLAALAECEDTSVRVLIEEQLLAAVGRAPRDPRVVRRAQADLLASTVGAARVRQRLTASLDEPARDPSPHVPLPGEQYALAYDPARTAPVTDDEALGVLRRRERGRGAPPPAQLPEWNAPKQAIVMRAAPRLMALVAALAELEGTNRTALIEEELYAVVARVPRHPDAVRAIETAMPTYTPRAGSRTASAD